MASTQTLTFTNGAMSQPIPVAAGTIVTITTTPTANATLQYTIDTDADVKNNVALWYNIGSTSITASYAVNKGCYIRLITAGGSVQLDINSTPALSDLEVYIAPVMQPNYVLSQGAIPYGIANSGTIVANGTVTLGTALSTIYTGGIWLYYPAAAFATLPAGFYWTVMSTTAIGIVYTSQTSGIIAVGSAGAYTGDTTQRTAVTVTLPAYSLGNNGSFRLFASASINNTAGAKTISTALGATQLTAAAGTTNTGINIEQIVSNRNSPALQRNANFTAATAAGSYATIDTTSDQAISVRLQLAVATDVIVMENWLIEIFPQN